MSDFFFKFSRPPKAELPQEGILFGTQFPSLGIFIDKLRRPSIQSFKTDIIKVVLVVSISNIFTNKNSQGRKLSAK